MKDTQPKSSYEVGPIICIPPSISKMCDKHGTYPDTFRETLFPPSKRPFYYREVSELHKVLSSAEPEMVTEYIGQFMQAVAMMTNPFAVLSLLQEGGYTLLPPFVVTFMMDAMEKHVPVRRQVLTVLTVGGFAEDEDRIWVFMNEMLGIQEIGMIPGLFMNDYQIIGGEVEALSAMQPKMSRWMKQEADLGSLFFQARWYESEYQELQNAIDISPRRDVAYLEFLDTLGVLAKWEGLRSALSGCTRLEKRKLVLEFAERALDEDLYYVWAAKQRDRGRIPIPMDELDQARCFFEEQVAWNGDD